MSEKKVKMKEERPGGMKILETIGFILGVTLFCSMCIRLVNITWTEEPSEPNNPVVEVPYEPVYEISYKGVVDGEVFDLEQKFFIPGGSYPREYVLGLDVEVDDLYSYVPVSAYVDYDFRGWYLDEACTQEFKSFLDDVTSDTVLYAKFVKGTWTKNY